MATVTFNSYDEIVDYVNQHIKENGNREITGVITNNAMIGILNYFRNKTNKTVEVIIGSDTNFIEYPDLVDAWGVKVNIGYRIRNNSVTVWNNDTQSEETLPPADDGYIHDPNTGRIYFAQTRGAGELFSYRL